jgi:hypothetical protein
MFRIIVLAIAVSSCFYGGWKLHKLQTESETLEKLNDAVRVYNEHLLKLQQESVDFEEFKVQAEKESSELKKRLAHAIKTDVRYQCVVPDSGMREIRTAIKAANAS